jgi:hypothetical protein
MKQVAAFSGVEPSESGLAAGLINTSQEVGGAFGVAVLSTVAAARTHHLMGPATGAPSAAALQSGYHYTLVTGTTLLGLALLVSLVLLDRSRRPEPHLTEDTSEPAGATS